MKLSPTSTLHCANRHRAGFTLAEVLAALAMMAIVIPVTVQGIQVASRAGTVGARKMSAARIADRVMNELEATGQLLTGAQNGVVQEGDREYRWTVQTQPWTEGNLSVAAVSVIFEVQGQEYSVRLATLMDPFATPASTLTTATETTP